MNYELPRSPVAAPSAPNKYGDGGVLDTAI